MRINANSPDGQQIKAVTLDGINITNVVGWVDPDNNEAGVYPHRLCDDGSAAILDMPDLFPLVTDSILANDENKPLHPTPTFVVRGEIELIFRDSEVAVAAV